MKRSSTVTIGLVAALAASLASCGQSNATQPTHQQTCVDAQNKAVDPKLCEGVRTAGGGGGFMPYHWYYMPWTGSSYPAYGTMMTGGSNIMPSGGGTSVVRSGSVSRGGFGSSFSGGAGA